MDSGQFEGADFKSDVCQIVSVEHFFLWHEIQDGRQENKMIFNCFTFRPLRSTICRRNQINFRYINCEVTCHHLLTSWYKLHGCRSK